MKFFRIAIVAAIIIGSSTFAWAENESSARWGNLIDVAYKFSWYPKKDFQDLITMKSEEYGASLEEYCSTLREELTDSSSDTGLIPSDAFVKGKEWRDYGRFAVGQFCLFLSNDNEVYLKNAQSALSVLSGKMELSNIAFWNYLLQAYSDLQRKDREALSQASLCCGGM